MKKFNKDIGFYCENLATEFLKNNSYTILDRNYKNHFGEIDIICLKDNILIIVEVKGRYYYKFGAPLESVTSNKQHSIFKVTKSYILYKKLFNINVRFDVIELYLNTDNSLFKINHIKDAFRYY